MADRDDTQEEIRQAMAELHTAGSSSTAELGCELQRALRRRVNLPGALAFKGLPLENSLPPAG